MNKPIGAGERRYAFGDSDLAAQRLGILARAFDTPSRSLLQQLRSGPLDLVLDLGCGPGHSTALLAEVLAPRRLAGLDQSEAFLGQARLSHLEAQWYQHDLTITPFPLGPADLAYARLVLAHVAEPERVVQGWMSQLAPGGLVVLEEDEDIVTEDPTLSRYELMAGDLVTARGGNLYIGRRLADLDFAGGEVVVNRVYDHAVPGADAARLFLMNFGVWRRDPLVVDRYPQGELDRLGQELSRIVDSSAGPKVLFRIRQLAVRRRSP